MLIERPNEVAARQWGQPGGVSLGSDPLVQELIAQGDEAVEPLLKCQPADGTVIPFRVCDLVAHLVSQQKGAPRIQLDWPEENGDRAVGEVVRFCTNYP